VRLSVAVQHHPSRSELLPRLLAALEPLVVDVVADPEPDRHPDPCRTSRRCLERTPAWATHRVVLQDDARPCRDFAAVAGRLAEAQPDALVVLCVTPQGRISAHDVLKAATSNRTWARLIRWQFVPVVGLLWPADAALAAAAWAAAQTWPRDCTADDEIVGRAARALDLDVLATVPSVVQHDDDVPSLTGLRWGGRPSTERQAAYFADDVSDRDWTLAPM
jgi:hypothetical protein